jgi:hypothetical protein
MVADRATAVALPPAPSTITWATMTRDQFDGSLNDADPPPDADPALRALWHDAKGEWAAAHAIVQDREGTPAYDRLHAYLHRKEGDVGNARYWYRRAGAAEFRGTLAAEWDELVNAHLV